MLLCIVKDSNVAVRLKRLIRQVFPYLSHKVSVDFEKNGVEFHLLDPLPDLQLGLVTGLCIGFCTGIEAEIAFDV